MKNKHSELNNRNISISISEKAIDFNFNIKKNKKYQKMQKELFQINKSNILTLEKDKNYKIRKFIKKVKNRKNICRYNENKYLKVQNFFLLFTFILLNLFLPLSLSFKTRKLDFTSIVNIFIKNSGNNKILSEKFKTLPDKIKINSKDVDPNITSYVFSTPNNTIQLIWEDQLRDCSYMFSECSTIASLDFSNFDSSKCVDMSKMFYKCYELEYLNISNLDTSSATDINNMFFGCEKLTTLDLSNFDTSKVVNMDCLFVFCKKIEYLNLEMFNTSSVNNMRSMFRGCSKLASVDLSSFNTSLVRRTQYMFKDCESLKYLDLSSFDSSKVKYMNGMFDGCTNLEEINLKNFSTSSVTEIMWMFQKCSKLKNLDLSSFDMSKVINATCMFSDCEALESIKFNNSNKMSEVVDISKMFYNCNKLTSLDLSFIYSSKIIRMEEVFYSCMNLITIDIQNLNTISVSNMNNIFVECYKLKYLNIYLFIENSNLDYNTILGVLPYDIIYCLKDYDQTQVIISNMNNKYSTNNCSYICNYENKKIINETNTCIDECNLDENHFYEFNNSCYDSCPFGTKSNTNNLCVESLEENTTNLIDISTISDTILKEESTSQKTEDKEEINKSSSDIKEEVSSQTTEIINSSVLSSLVSEKIQEEPTIQKTEVIETSSLNYNIETTISTIEVKKETTPATELGEDIISSSSDLKDENTISTIEVEERTISLTNEATKDTISQTNENKDITKTEIASTQNNIIESSIINNKLTEEITIPTEIRKDIISTNYLNQNTTSYIEIATEKGSIFKDEKNKTEVIEEEDYINISINCTVEEFLNKTCEDNDIRLESKENIINSIKKNIMNGNIKSLIENVANEEKQDLTVDYKDAIYQITSSDNQNNKVYNNISTIKLGECENKLKDYYNLSQSENLLIFKVDVYEEGLLIPIVEYEIYHPYTLEKLDLEICKNQKIQISLPAVIDDEDIDKHDPTSNYYNDKCYPSSSENGADIILIDRQNEFINNNLTLCENNCKFIGYNTEIKQALCECDIKNEINLISSINIDKDKLLSNFKDLKSLINLDIVKCYDILFTTKGLIKNIGSYILLSTIFLFIISSFIFFGIGFTKLTSQIRDIMTIKEINMFSNKIELKHVMSNKSKFKNKKKDNIKNKNKNKSDKKKNEKKNNKDNAKNKINKVKTKANNKKHKREPPLKNKTKLKNKNNSSTNIILKTVTSKTLSHEKSSNILFFSQKNMLVIKKRNDIANSQKIKYLNDNELNSLSYEDALIYDKRTYFQYYLSLLRTKHLLVFSFYPNRDYNSMIIKICLFFFSFVLYLTVNTLFYTDSTIHNIYQNSGKFDFNYHIPQILYSTLISTIINMLVKSLSLSEKNILEIKHEKDYKSSQRKTLIVLRCLKIKFIHFFIISFIFLDLFWYYLACFCAVYSNTQYHVLNDTFLSFCLSLVYPLFINLIPGFFRIKSLKKANHEQQCLYKTSKIIQLI